MASFSIEQFEEEGYTGPVRVMSVRDAALVARLCAQTLEHERIAATPRPPSLAGWHARHPWAYELAACPALVTRVQALLRAQVSVWASEIWYKVPRSTLPTPWHQDGVFYPAPATATVSAWVAITEASRVNGGLAVVPRSHGAPVEHVPTPTSSPNEFDRVIPDNSISAGAPRWPSLSPGEAIFFGGALVHGAEANGSSRPRLAYAIRYLARDAQADVAVRGLEARPRPGGPPIVMGWPTDSGAP